MSDYNSSLPIRTENPGDAIVKIADATLPSQQLAVNADGSVNITDNGGSITVDGSVTVSATDLDIRDLSAAQDSIAISDGTDTLGVNADGSINVQFAPGAEIKITDGTDDLAVNADGSINAVVTATDLDIRDLAFATDKVDVSGSSVTVSATDLDVRDLSAAQDNVAISDGTDTLAVNADGSINITDNGGSITVDGSVTVSSTDLDIRDLSAAQDNVAISDGTDTMAVNADGSINAIVSATDLDIRDLAFATDKVDVSGSSVTVSATDLDVRDLTHASDSIKIGDGTDFLAVNADGSINVKISDASPGTDVADFNTTATVAGGASSNHDYTSTGNFYLTQIEASGSGKMKIEVLVNGVSKFVQFNSTATPNMSIVLKQPILATTGQVVRVIRTNRENQAQDVYSTILGFTE